MLILPDPKDAIHKLWLFRLLTGIADKPFLAQNLFFKGGTCAAMRGILPRFSVDLDFDLADYNRQSIVREVLESVFDQLGLTVDDFSKQVPQYFLKYKNEPNQRNSIKLDVTFPFPKSNDYESVRFPEIDRILLCQTVPTMFANKLVTVTDRYQRHGSLASRDLFDIHTFFMKGYRYKDDIICERTGKPPKVFLKELKAFIQKHFTQTLIDQDLNAFLSPADFHGIRAILKQEVLMFLEGEEHEMQNLKNQI
ncbi:hypothetical protein COY07_04990 [Candidatus Peregrinibacteria bacterium CG_4_10_14_0_2_um_filter_43_11]|nr:MAG: hypothetical protein COY07_04990 [Candidatus Peregrinibacteria bacterium CG_4_10_14_0_2_um_filter_43_11]